MRLARDCAIDLQRVVAGHKTFHAGHQILTQHATALEEDLHVFFEETGLDTLILDLESEAIRYDGEVVWQGERRSRSFTHRVFLDGMQRIVFHVGVSRQELDALIDIWVQSVYRPADNEHNFVTRFWEASFEKITGLTLEALELAAHFHRTQQQAEQKERVEIPDGMDRLGDILGELTTADRVVEPSTYDGDGPSMPISITSWLRVDPDRVLELSTTPEPVETLVDPEHPLRLTPEETEGYLATIMEPPDLIVRRGVWALLSTYDGTAHRRGAIVDRLTQLHVSLFELAHFQPSRQLLKGAAARMARAAQPDDPMRINDEMMLESFRSPAVLELMVPTLDDPHWRAVTMELLFTGLKDEAAWGLIPWLPRLRTDQGRGALSKIIRNAEPPPSLLIELLENHGLGVINEVLDIIARAEVDRTIAVFSAGLAHHNPEVRLRTLQAMSKQLVVTMAGDICALVDDEDATMRERAVSVAVSSRLFDVVPALSRRLRHGYETRNERFRLIAALGAVGGKSAARTLIDLLENEPDIDVKIAAALALGRTQTPQAARVLREHAKGVFANRKLKEACHEGLRRLNRRPRTRQTQQARLSGIPNIHNLADLTAGDGPVQPLPEEEETGPWNDHTWPGWHDGGFAPPDEFALVSASEDLYVDPEPSVPIFEDLLEGANPHEEDDDDPTTVHKFDGFLPPVESFWTDVPEAGFAAAPQMLGDEVARPMADPTALTAPQLEALNRLRNYVVADGPPGFVTFGLPHGIDLVDLHIYPDNDAAYRHFLLDKLSRGLDPVYERKMHMPEKVASVDRQSLLRAFSQMVRS